MNSVITGNIFGPFKTSYNWSHLQRVRQITINTLGPTTWTNTLQQARHWNPFTSLVIVSNTVGPAYNEFVRLLRTTLHYLRRVRL